MNVNATSLGCRLARSRTTAETEKSLMDIELPFLFGYLTLAESRVAKRGAMIGHGGRIQQRSSLTARVRYCRFVAHGMISRHATDLRLLR
jgi:hypothetical protein